MNGDPDWPPYLIGRAIAQVPSECFAVEGSTPVVAFGDPVSARVATLGINPSFNEFLNRRRDLLAGKKRRLTTFESLDLEHHTSLTKEHGQSILDGCADYFSVQP